MAINTPTPSSFEAQIRKAIIMRLEEISKEEAAKAAERIQARIVADAAQLAPTILSRMDWTEMGAGEIRISIKGRT